MHTFAFIVGAVLPFVAVLVFAAGMTRRFRIWFKTPQPGKITLFPAADSTLKGVLAEALFFPSLFRGDRSLWAVAWLFHAMLALVLLGHVRVFTGALDRLLITAGMQPEDIGTMSNLAGGAAGIVLLATGLFLLFRRLVLTRVREISGVPDFLAPLLLIAIIVTGDWMRFAAPFELEQARLWAASLLALSPIVPRNGMFLIHAALAQTLIIFIPFSKILHFGGIFFTQALVKRS